MREIVATGSCALLKRLRRELPPTITGLRALRRADLCGDLLAHTRDSDWRGRSSTSTA